jgi:hypothetical protein
VGRGFASPTKIANTKMVGLAKPRLTLKKTEHLQRRDGHAPNRKPAQPLCEPHFLSFRLERSDVHVLVEFHLELVVDSECLLTVLFRVDVYIPPE